MYAHAVPRSSPRLIERLASLAALARTPLGGQTRGQYARIIQAARANHAAYLGTLGTRNDAATALGYSLLVDQVFPASGLW